MRYSHAALTKRVSLAVVAALVALLVFAAAASAMPDQPLGPSVPNGPHCFYGKVMTDRGITLPGSTVVAKALAGYWTGQMSVISDSASRYGYTPTFCIPGYESGSGTGAKVGDLIGFRVNGVQARLYDVAAGKLLDAFSYPFSYYGGTELDLIVPLQMAITATAGPNGAIDPSGTVLVDYGQNKTFTFQPAVGYRIDKVLVDGVEDAAAAAAGYYTFTNVRSAHTIHVTFARITFIIKATAGSNGAIDPAGDVVVGYGDNQKFTFLPDTGYKVDKVWVDGAEDAAAAAAGSYTFTNVQAAHTIHVTFTKLTFIIKATAGLNGTIDPAGDVVVEYGQDKMFTFSPDAGYKIDKVLVDGAENAAAAAAGSYTFTNVQAAHTIHVTFAKITFIIKATAGPNGTINPSGDVVVDQGQDKMFTFSPATGYKIDKVLVDGVEDAAAAAAGSYTFANVQAAHTIHVTFARITFIITATAGSNGTIDPAGDVVVGYGENQNFTFHPAAGYTVDTVLVDGVEDAAAAAAGSYTFTNVQAGHTIHVTFKVQAVPAFRIFLPIIFG